jgi:hypothetical protein
MSARENLLRKSCRAPADNHFIYVSHRQHSCGKKDLYQRFLTTDENVTLSANTRLPSFLADRQSAVLKRAKEVLDGLIPVRSIASFTPYSDQGGEFRKAVNHVSLRARIGTGVGAIQPHTHQSRGGAATCISFQSVSHMHAALWRNVESLASAQESLRGWLGTSHIARSKDPDKVLSGAAHLQLPCLLCNED